MALTVVYHPHLPGAFEEVPDSEVALWLAAGWLPDPPPGWGEISAPAGRSRIYEFVARPDAGERLRAWRAAAGTRRSAGTWVWEIGTSITVGSGSSDAASRGWRALLASNLRARLPQAVPGGAGYQTVDFAVLAGGASLGTDFGPGYRHAVMGAPTDTVTWSGVSGTSFDVVWPRGGGGTLGVKIDGGAVQNVSQTGAFGDAVKTNFALSAGSHTVQLSAVSGTTFATGIVTYNGDETTGVRHVGAGHYGGTAGDFVTKSVAPGYFASQLALFPPSLVVLDFGANDFITPGVTSAAFKASMTTIIAALNALPASPSIVVPFWPQRSDGVPVEDYESYWARIEELADAYPNVTALDMRPYLGPSVADDDFGLFADTAHPSDRGHGIIADVLTSVLADPVF